MGWFWKKKAVEEKEPVVVERLERPRALPEPVEAEAEPRPKPARRRKRPPMEVRLLAVRGCEAGLAAKEMAKLADVSASTISKWCAIYRKEGVDGLARRPSAGTTRKICRALEERITTHREAHPEHGVRRVRDELRRNENLAVSAETVRRVVNDADLGQPPPKAKRRPVQIRRFERAVPNAMWQIDIFTFELKRMYRVYLIGMIDDHSRYIVGHGLYRQQKAEAVMEVVKGAIGQWGAPRELLSDNGRQFVAWRGKSAFQKLMTRQGIGHVRSAPHHPMTLGKIERFWKTIWTEFLSDAQFASFADATQRLAHWIAYYNHQRPHQGIKGACPADRFYGMADDVEAAVGQGCKENSLRLALGQEPEPPLYLLGKLGGTDVRVTRKGEEIEVKLGEQVHEVIRMGAAFTLDEDGRGHREEADDEVEGSQRRGAVPGGGDGSDEGRVDQGAVRDLRGVAPDLEPGGEDGGRGGSPCPGTQDPGPQGQDPQRAGDHRAQWPSGGPQQRTGTLEDEVRGGGSLPGSVPQVRQGGIPGEALGCAEKKASQEEARAKQEIEPAPYELLWREWASDEDGESG